MGDFEGRVMASPEDCPFVIKGNPSRCRTMRECPSRYMLTCPAAKFKKTTKQSKLGEF
jgi:hypothetical protein